MPCAALGALSLDSAQFHALARKHEYLDARASSQVALLAYAAAGALPHPDTAARPRHDTAQPPPPEPAAGQPDLRSDVELASPLLECAVCRAAGLELSLAADLVAECSDARPSPEQRAMLWAAPSVLCDHMEASGLLGHCPRVLAVTRHMCDVAVVGSSPDEAQALRRALLAEAEAPPANGSLVARMCAAACDGRVRRARVTDDGWARVLGELDGWPTLLQLLLDSEGEPLQPSLRRALLRSRREDKLDSWRVGGGAAEALVTLAAARSDNTALKLACALGGCGRIGQTAPDAPAMLDLVLSVTPTHRLAAAAPGFMASADAARWLTQLHWEGGAGWMSAVHAAAFTLDEEALRTLLLLHPTATPDAHGRTPVHYAAAGADRLRGLSYMFSEQPFRTWLRSRSASGLGHAPPVLMPALVEELDQAGAAAVAQLIRERPGGTGWRVVVAVDDLGRTPLHMAAAGGSVAQLQLLWCALPAEERPGLLQLRDGDGLDARAHAAAAGHARAAGWLARAKGWACGEENAAGEEGEAEALAAAEAHAEALVGERSVGEAVPGDASVSEAASCAVSGGAAEVIAHQAQVPAHPAAPCDIRELGPEDEAALRRAALLGRPVLVRGGAASWPAAARLSREPFLSALGGVEWQPQLLLRGSNATRLFWEAPDRTLRAYLDGAAAVHRPVLFNRPRDPSAMRSLVAMVGSAPDVIPREWRAGGVDGFVGPRGSGVPMHSHGPVWNALAWGSKLWALTPPSRSRFAPEGQHSLDSEWAAEWAARGRGGPRNWTAFCVQGADDLMFVPGGWGHATLFLSEGLGVGGFLHERGSLGLHMQLLHAPRSIGTLQNAATIHNEWRLRVGAAFAAAPTPAATTA